MINGQMGRERMVYIPLFCDEKSIMKSESEFESVALVSDMTLGLSLVIKINCSQSNHFGLYLLNIANNKTRNVICFN